ncbi:MAG: hypothetical protein LBE38_02040 [Deltaproteobacteria bacterium]|nr:hypothetical protein [Deltaproteobacteria bacterium]
MTLEDQPLNPEPSSVPGPDQPLQAPTMGGGQMRPGDSQLPYQPPPHVPPPAAPQGPSYNISDVQGFLDLDDAAEGIKSALVVYDNEEIQNLLEEKLMNMGYRVYLAINVRDAVKQLKFGTFQVVLLQEDYYGANIKSNQLLKAINNLEVRTRHKMFIGLIGPSFTSLDDLLAFSLSLDTVINTKDLDDIERLLISATGHVSKFFATYNEMRAQRGVD